MGTAAGALGRLVRLQDRLAKAEAAADALRTQRDATLREALSFRENTYTVVHERTGIARATITKASRRG